MTAKKVEPYLMSVLSSRLDGITLEMINTILRTARSQVLSVARDFSTAILDHNGEVIAAPQGIPVHCANMGLTAKYLFEHPDGIHEGDLFLSNSPYHGCTHPADYTYVAPVFHDGKLMFFTFVRAHQADCGNHLPTTYYARAKDVYEEGALIWPVVKIQKNYKDVDDIINIAKMRIRVPESWYGDYLAAVGAIRTSEKQLIKICKQYGNDLIYDFTEAYQQYGEARILEELSKLSTQKAVYEFPYDAVPGFSDDITIHLEAQVDQESGDIIVDVTKNVDALDWGLNLSEATTLAACKSGIITQLDNVPRIDGAMKHIKVLMRDNCILGVSKHPKSYSAATTNVMDRTMSGMQVLMNQLKSDTGIAECGTNLPGSCSCISGLDFRNNDEPFMTQIHTGASGGPGVKGHDGWITFIDCGVSGCARWNTIEILEQQYPVMVLEEEVIPNGIGSGEFDSSPALKTVFTARKHPVTFAYSSDGARNAPKGAAGGLKGTKIVGWRYNKEEGIENRTICEPYTEELISDTEFLVSECSSGGGYGDPLDRDPEKVRHRAREGWITVDYAKAIYGVVLDTSVELYAVDEERTKELRKKLKEQKSKGECK